MSDELNLENLDASRLRSLLSRLPKLLPMRQLPRSNRSLTFPQNLTHPSTMQMLSPTLRRRLNPLPFASTQTETVSLDEDEEEVNESEQAEETDAGQQAVDEFSKSLRSLDGKWYVLHTYSGYEKRVKTNIESRVASFGMEDQIFQVEVPMEEVEKHTEKGKKVITAVRGSWLRC